MTMTKTQHQANENDQFWKVENATQGKPFHSIFISLSSTDQEPVPMALLGILGEENTT